MKEYSGFDQKDLDPFSIVNYTYNYISTKEKILKQLYFEWIIL